MARARKLSKSNRTKVTIENYGKIAKALGINIGPKARPLCDQLQDKKLSSSTCRILATDMFKIDSLYRAGYDVKHLYAEVISRIQDEILKTLPF